jgi:hypothetical protein
LSAGGSSSGTFVADLAVLKILFYENCNYVIFIVNCLCCSPVIPCSLSLKVSLFMQDNKYFDNHIMGESHKFRILNPKKFLKKDLIKFTGEFSNSRRMALKKLSYLTFVANPLVRTIDSALTMPFTISKKGKALCFFLDNELAWEINPEKFGTSASLFFQESGNGYTIKLREAEYPSTGIIADFNASIHRKSGYWNMDIEFPGLDIGETISFDRWLRGDELKGRIKRDLLFHLGENDSFQLPAPAGLTVDRNWIITLYPDSKIVLNIFSGNEYYRFARFSLGRAGVPGWISEGYLKQATYISLHEAHSRFLSFGRLKFKARSLFNISSYPFSQTGIVIGRSKTAPAAVFWASNPANSHPADYSLPYGDDFTLSFSQSRFYKEYTGDAEPFLFVADMGNEQQWIGMGGASFALTSSKDCALTIHGEGNEVSGMDTRARLVQTRISVEGASSLPVSYSGSPELHLLIQDPQTTRPQAVRQGQVQNPLNIQRTEDGRNNWLYINREATRIRFRTDRSILFNLIRPNDFLNLQLEYVNFILDGNLLKIDDIKSPAFLIVHFPSQHTREEMFKVPEPPRVPVRYARAKSSRIVFKVPSGNPAIPLTLDYLLDWGNFEIQVNYRARWFNTGRLKDGLLKEQLLNLSMVFSSSGQKREGMVRGPEQGFHTRRMTVIDQKPGSEKQVEQPMSALEIKVALSASPEGTGKMSLTDQRLGNLLAITEIETTLVDNIRGAMTNLFEMNAPSIYETSIEAPAWLEISPNQFAGFAHIIGLKDEFGEYEETSVQSIDISDDITTEAGKLSPGITGRQGDKEKLQPGDIYRPGKSIMVTPGEIMLTKKQSYKDIFSPAFSQLPSALLVHQGQLFELWHTRMGIKLASGEIDEDSLSELKSIRVLWSPCANEKMDRGAKAAPGTGKPFYSLPTPGDLHELVHLTSNYNDLRQKNSKVKTDPRPVRAKRLMLSGLGAWFDYEFRDDREIDGVSLQAWLQRATMGRDHYIKLVNRGYLFPFGHKAVKVSIAERKLRMVGDIYSAVIIVREFIIVQQPELLYDKGGNQEFIPFPFLRAEIKDREKQITTRKIIQGEDIYELYDITDSEKPASFNIEMDDASGQTIRLELPLVFIEARVKDQSVAVKHYTGAGWNYFSSSAVSKPVAFARSLIPGDTSFQTRMIMFGARITGYDLDGVRYFPEVKESTVYIKQIEELTGVRKSVRIQLVDDNNLSMVFARVHQEDKAELIFGDSESSGGFINPDMRVTGFSKLTGITGNEISNLDNLIVASEKIFSLADSIPKIFGVINFIDILLPVVNLTGAVNAIKNQVEQLRNLIETRSREIMSMMARADSEIKKMERFLFVVSGLLQEKGMLSLLQDTAAISQSLETYGIVPAAGTMAEAVNATATAGREIQARGINLLTLIDYLDNPQGLRNVMANAGANIELQTVEKMLHLVKGLYNDGFREPEIIALINALGMASHISGLQTLIKAAAENISGIVIEAIPEIPHVKSHRKGDEVIVEYHWKPKTLDKYSIPAFQMQNLNKNIKQIEVSVDSIMRKSIDNKVPPILDSSASINNFTVIIAQSLQLNFERFSFRSVSGSKPSVDIKFKAVPIRFTGTLSFVNSLQKVISPDQFSAGPFVDTSVNGIMAGFNFPLPDIEVGILSLSNMMLGTRLNLPFNNAPLTIGFNFSSRENPFRVLVSCFGGGGFFSMESTIRGLTKLEAAFEFGAGIALNVGVASGSVEAMGGIYYCLITDASGNTTSLAAYLRITGRLSVLKLIRVTLEFYLELLYEGVGGQKEIIENGIVIMTVDRNSRLAGTASLMVKVEVLLFSKTVKIVVQRTLTGNDADPKFEETYSNKHWQDYCAAFAS